MEQSIFENYHNKKLTKNEMNELFRKYRKTKDEKIKEKLNEANLGLITKTISVYFTSAPSYLYEDLIAEGLRALSMAIEKYNVDEDVAFSSYAVVVIRRRMTCFLGKERKYQNIISLDAPVKNEDNGDEVPLIDLFVDDSEDMQEQITEKIEVQEIMRDIYCFLNQLKPREREIFIRFWGLNGKKETYEAIAKDLGISSSRVGQVVTRLLFKLKVFLLYKGSLTKEDRIKLAKSMHRNLPEGGFDGIEC